MASPEIISGLGSRDSVIHLSPGAEQRGLTGEELALGRAAGAGTPLGEVLRRAGLPEPRAIALLLSMRMRGLIGPGKLAGAAAQAVARPAPQIDLAALAEAVDLDEGRKREILEAEARCQDANLFRVLGLPDGEEAAQVKKAYYELTKAFHPDRYYGKALGSFKGRVEKVFKRFTEAQAVLTDANRRAAWLQEHPQFAGAPAEAVASEHSEERRARLSRHPYMARFAKVHELTARGKQALEKGDFARAQSDLNQASQIDPKNADLQKLLVQAKKGGDKARAQREFVEGESAEKMGDLAGAIAHFKSAAALDLENAKLALHLSRLLQSAGGESELKDAVGFARRAAELEPNNADCHLAYAKVLLRAGLEKNAAREYEQVLKLRPGDATAKEQLRKLKWKF